MGQSNNMHKALRNPLHPPFPDGYQIVQFGMGCFWGAEKAFWQHPNIYSTQVGYSGGSSPNPSYRLVCSGTSGHVEVVRVVYDPTRTRFAELLKIFWENHDPTQGNKQGNDEGTQYRSVIFVSSEEQLRQAELSKQLFQEALTQKGFPRRITTEIALAPEFYYAEDYHQQYLHDNPDGYCGHGHTGAKLDLSRF